MKTVVTCSYKNWKGIVGVRNLIPVRIWFGTTQWHPEQQWLMEAFDIDTDPKCLGPTKDFALLDMMFVRSLDSIKPNGDYYDQ